jgi:hypothetical protein
LIVGSDDLRVRVLEYLENVQRAKVVTEYPTPGTFGDDPVSITESLSSGVYRLAVASPSAASGTAAGRILSYNTADSDVLGRITQVPYKRQSGTTYHLGFRYQARPTFVASSSGLLHLSRYKLTMGELGAPDTVTANGDGTMTFNVNTLATAASGGAWANSSSEYRRAHVWMVNPVDAGLAIVEGQAKSNGTNVTVAVAHSFGQETPSTSTAAYLVLLEGLSVSTTNLSTQTDSEGNLSYWYLGTVLDGTVSTAAQNTIKTFGSLARDLAFLETEASNVLKWGLAGPAIYIPGLAETEAWSQSLAHSATGPATETFELDPLPAGSFIYTADAEGRMRVVRGLAADTVAFSHNEASGDYVLFVLAVDSNASAAVEAMVGQLTIAAEATYNSTYSDCLEVARFEWNTGTNAVVSETLADLARTRRPHPESRADILLSAGAAAPAASLAVDELSSRAVMRVSLFHGADRVDQGVEPVMLRLRRIAGTHRELWLYGPDGEDDGAGSTDLAGSEVVDFALGGANDWLWRAEAGQLSLGTAANPTAANYLRFTKADGNQEDTSLSVKPRVLVPDLHLIGAGGKLVERTVHMDHSNAAGSGWTFNGHRWSCTTANAPLYFQAPQHRVGEALVGFRVIGWLTGTDAGDAMSATIQRTDCDNASSGWTAESLSSSVTWVHPTDSAPTSKLVTLASEVAGATADRWALRLVGTFASAGPATFYVSQVLARYRVVQI